jgi:hypothetical protein
VWQILLAGLLVTLGDLALLNLRFGHQKYSSTWSEAAVVFGLVLVPWPWLTLIAPVSVAVAHSLTGRSRVKVLFNAMTMAVAATLARVVSTVIVGGHEVTYSEARRGVLGVFALGAGTFVFFVCGLLAVSAAIAFSQDVPIRDVVTRGLGVKLAVFAGNTSVALLLVHLTWSPGSVALVPLFVLLLFFAYRGYLAAVEDRDTWQRLEAASKDVAQLDAERVAYAAAEHALQLFHADRVDVLVRSATPSPLPASSAGRRLRRA